MTLAVYHSPARARERLPFSRAVPTCSVVNRLLGGVMNRIKFALRLSVVALMASVLGHAQTGSIQGTVTDKSGAT